MRLMACALVSVLVCVNLSAGEAYSVLSGDLREREGTEDRRMESLELLPLMTPGLAEQCIIS
jgi:hypothetical protein